MREQLVPADKHRGNVCLQQHPSGLLSRSEVNTSWDGGTEDTIEYQKKHINLFILPCSIFKEDSPRQSFSVRGSYNSVLSALIVCH